MTRSTLALVLAAGFSRRFDGDKRLGQLPDGTTVIEALLRTIGDAGLACSVVQNSERLLPLPAPFRSIEIPVEIAARGMGASLAAAIRELPVESDLIICLADMPFVQPSTYAAIAAALRPGRIVCPRYRGERGNPVGFAKEFREELMALDGDRGARDLLQKYADRVDFTDVDDPGIQRDIDTPADLR